MDREKIKKYLRAISISDDNSRIYDGIDKMIDVKKEVESLKKKYTNNPKLLREKLLQLKKQHNDSIRGWIKEIEEDYKELYKDINKAINEL